MCVAIFICDAEISFLGTRHDLTLNLLNYSFDRWDRFPLPPKKSSFVRKTLICDFEDITTFYKPVITYITDFSSE